MSPNPPASVHTTGPRKVYINKKPCHGETSFPVGTIIVKEVDMGDIPDRQVFAMVKRGSDFDSAGAVGWEWFELTNVDDTTETVLWHGVAPPLADGYLNLNGGCNGCHAVNPANDYVQTTGLQLSSF